MDIEGTYTLQAAPEDVWHCLMDQRTLQSTIPGIEHIEVIGADRYAITIHVGPTPLTGTYQGHITVTEQLHPSSYHIAVKGEGRESSINGVGDIHLSNLGENTIVAYKGKLDLGKLEVTVPAPVARGAIKLLIQQFFTALAEQLLATGHSPTTKGAPAEGIATFEQPGGKIVILPAASQPLWLATIVRRLRLGAGDPALETQWVNRLRRTGIVLGLLLLVWVGTRIPKR